MYFRSFDFVAFEGCGISHVAMFCLFVCLFFGLQSALITEEKAAEFRHLVYLPITLTKVAEYVLIITGTLFILPAVMLALLGLKKKKYITNKVYILTFVVFLANA